MLSPGPLADPRTTIMSQTVVKPRTKVKPQTQRPPLWKVILLNDDFTPREFVVQVLKAVFRMNESQAYRVPSSSIGFYTLPFALGNFFGPLLLGRFFDTVGRKPMISFTYAAAGCLLAVTGYLFLQGAFTSVTQTLAWSCVFFFA